MLAYYMNSAELQRWLSTLRHPGNNGNYEMFTQHYTIGEDYMKDIMLLVVKGTLTSVGGGPVSF